MSDEITKPEEGKVEKKELNLTLKQRKWIKAYIKTGNATEAAKLAGYDANSNHAFEVIGSDNLRKLEIRDLMEEMGLTDVALINIGVEGMTKANKQSITGEIFPDYGTRRGYWETLLKLKGKLNDSKVQIAQAGGEMKIEFTDE
jgi:hypothetical protein